MELSKEYCGKRRSTATAGHQSSRGRLGEAARRLCVLVGLLFLLATPSFYDGIAWAAEGSQHDTSDGGHGGGHAGSPWDPLWKWGNFLILFGGLGWYLRKPLSEFLESRSRSIEEGLASGRVARESALKQLQEIEDRMQHLDDEVGAVKAQAAKEAEDEKARILQAAQLEAQKILEVAQREIEGLKKSARLELKAHVAELAVKLAEEQLKQTVGPEANKRLAVRFLESLETAKN